MKTSDFDYALPESLVARRPVERRDESRLMTLRRCVEGSLYNPDEYPLGHRSFRDLPESLRAGDLLVMNRSRVIPARLVGRRASGGNAGQGGAVELLLLEEMAPLLWRAMVRPGRKMRPGERVVIAPGELEAVVEQVEDEGPRWIRFETRLGWAEALARFGHTPLPPYILKARQRDDPAAGLEEEADRERYQAVYAGQSGTSIAAPTAGFHFTPELMARCEAMGVRFAHVELDVGPATFQPVEAENPIEHAMHEERFRVDEAAAAAIRAAKAEGRRIVAVGTTSLRVLETLGELSNAKGGDLLEAVRPREGRTRLFVMPGFEFRLTDALITNFHLPRSTLLMLVAAFAGYENAMRAYGEAVRLGYRFYSYGDAMFVG